MNGNNFEWDYDADFFDCWCCDEDSERRIAENTISNDDFLIYHTSENEFRTYVIKELNRLNSVLSNN